VFLTVTIDTEEDNWGEYDRASYSVENINRVPNLQRVFDTREVRPTYLISYPIATSAMAVDVLRPILERRACEIGTHPHPWNTPPLEEQRTAHNSFISNLDSDLQFRKIKTLHEAITSGFGTAPTAYRSGRWGFNDNVARNLMRLNYKIDTSISAVYDWTPHGGPSYWHEPPDPFRFEWTDPIAGRRELLEVPATNDFVQRPRELAAAAYRTIERWLPLGGKGLALLSRMRLLNHVSLSPETHSAALMIRLIRAMRERGATVVNMFFHSPSLLEGCSPFVKSAADAEAFVSRIDEVMAFAQAEGLRFATMSELRAGEIGATAVRALPAGQA
jgi:hypothetical protein